MMINKKIKNILNTMKFTKSLKIRQKLTYTYILISIVPVAILAAIFINVFLHNVEVDAGNYTIQILAQINKSIDNYVLQVDNLMMSTYNNEALKKHLAESADITGEDDEKFLQVNQISQSIGKDIYYLAFGKNDIRDIILVDNQGLPYYFGVNKLDYNYEFMKKDFFQRILKANGQKVILGTRKPDYLMYNDKEFFGIGRVIRDYNESQIYGILLLDISTDIFTKICNEVTLGKSGQIILQDKDGNVLYGTNGSNTLNTLQKSLVDKYFQSNKNSAYRVNFEGTEYLVTASISKYTGWKIIGIVPFSELTDKMASFLKYTLVVLSILIVAAIIISYLVSTSISRPIKRLHSLTREIRNGNFNVRSDIHSSDEIGELSESFNKMTSQVDQLFKEQHKMHYKEKEARLDILFNQINPHFMYNFLDSASMCAVCNNDNETAHLIAALSNFFRFIVKENRITTIVKEMGIIRNYLELQNMRYEGKFRTVIDIDREIETFLIPKMTLQPIVENAILHGILESDRLGELMIKGFRLDSKIIIEVTDNGIGMTNVKLSKVIEEVQSFHSDNRQKVGLKNINERLKIYFGEPFGLEIESIYDTYSKIIVRIPAVINEGDLSVKGTISG